MRPKGDQLSATTTNQSYDAGTLLRSIIIFNDGDNDCYIDFDNAVNTSNSFLLKAGDSLNLDNWRFQRLHYQAAANTTTLRILKLIQ